MKVRSVTRVPVKGRHVSPDAVPDFDNWPAGRPAIDLWLAARILAGMAPKAIVVASGGAFSLRTAYRWKRALVALVEIEVGGYVATYAIRRDQAPGRLTTWTRAA